MIYSGDELVLLGRAYMAATGTSATKLGTLAAGHNRLFDRLFAGYDCRTQAAERASDWFDRNWPEDLPWPDGVWRRREWGIAA